MATIYLRSTDGSDASDGLTWADAKATLAAAMTAAGAGGRVYVSDNHAETSATNYTLTSPGTAASPTEVICVDDSAEPPTALATTATLTLTGTGQSISFAGYAYCYGMTFIAGDGADTSNILFQSQSPWGWWIRACKLKVGGTGPGAIAIGASANMDAQILVLDNTPFEFTAVGQQVLADSGQFFWRNTASGIQGTVPTTLFGQQANRNGCRMEVSSVDLSAAGVGKNICTVAASMAGQWKFYGCKLGASVTLVTGTHPDHGGTDVEFVTCDSGDTNYRYQKQGYTGTITQETVIVRTGGASDGTTPISYKFATTANSKHYSPLYGPWAYFWNETTGSAVTVTAEVVTDNVTLTDAEAWIEVEHLGTSGTPFALFEKDQLADPIFGTPANQTTSSETWTTTGLATPVKQKLSEAVTPQEKGPIRARVVLAKPSTTMYADFKFAA